MQAKEGAMIIDSHCHAGKGDGLTGPWDTAALLDKYLRRASQAGITRSVLFAAFHSDYAVANREVARIVASRPDRFFGFAFINAVRDRGRVMKLVRQAVEEFGFVGIKLHRYDARISREVCEVARAFSLPVLYDVMGEVAVCELLAQEYPDVNFVIPHLGSFADDWRAQIAFVDRLERHSNIYTDTSGCADLTYWNRLPAGQERGRCYSAPTGPGFILGWNWRRCAHSASPGMMRAWCSRAISFG
jgi:predicted TIM-barrel fold metal-dependent hydrolase